jgi:acyl carrier protein
VHAAGVDQTAALIALDKRQFFDVCRAKVDGVVWLDELTRDQQLDAFICFSSAASLWGASGRAHYAAANAFLDGWAAQRHARGQAALSINWGPWTGGGMARAGTLQQFERIGNRGLRPEVAIQAMECFLASKVYHGAVVDVQWPRFRSVLEARRPRPLFSQVETCSPQTPPNTQAAPSALSNTTNSAITNGLLEIVRQELAATLGHHDPSAIAPHQTFGRLGLDSLLAVEFVTRLGKRLGRTISPAIFEFGNLAAFVAHLEHHGKASVSTSEAPENPVVAEPTSLTGSNAAAEPVQPQACQRPKGVGVVRTHRTPTIPEKQIVEFTRQAWPRRPVHTVVPRWRWMFLESAQRLGLEPLYWTVADEHENWLAFMGAIPVEVQVHDRVGVFWWLVDTMVLEPFRREAYGLQLMAAAEKELPFSLSLGQSAEMRQILDKLGWRVVASQRTLVLPLKEWDLVRHRFSGKVMAAPAAVALRLAVATRRLWIGKIATSVELKPVVRYGSEHDTLWEQVRHAYPCAVRRNASYLNWKFVDQPGQEFLRWDCYLKGSLIGSAVVRTDAPNKVYPYRRAYLVDVLIDANDSARVRAVFSAIARQCEALGAAALVWQITDSRLVRLARQLGFVDRGITRYVLVGPGPAPAEFLPEIESPHCWLATMGDSDIDRPQNYDLI